MSDDFNSFKQDDGTEPPDGEHTAWLERAVVRDTRNGKAVKAEWRTTDMAYWWESWHNTTGGGKGRTQQLLGELGIDLEQLGSWDELGDELALRENEAYVVRVSRSSDGRFLNTAVVEKPQGVQVPLDNGRSRTEFRSTVSDIPADTGALPEPAPAGTVSTGGLFDDDDVPF
jgi:hypothetical protein